MNEFITKLTSLSYEFFGILLPGFIAVLFTAGTWAGLGDLVPRLTMSGVPKLTMESAKEIVTALTLGTGIGVAIPLAIVSYFAGHSLMWIARRGKGMDCGRVALIRHALLFAVPKPLDNFEPKLKGIFDKVRETFSSDGRPLEWREFYPIGKCFLSRNNSTSLVATYQTKYTLHRSLAIASAGWFWINIIALIVGFVGSCVTGLNFHPGWLAVFTFSSLFLVWGFAES